MRTKFTGAAGRTSCICISAHHSFCGYCNRYKYAMEETTSGLTGLLLLVPYYCILYFLRDKLKKRFIFTLKKLN